MRLIVTGLEGQVVRSLIERGAARDVEIIAVGRPQLDLANEASIEAALMSVPGDIIINAAAYTAVDKAETEEALAMQINGAGAGAVSRIAASRGLPIIHLSTDYVFDGTLDRPYCENDPVAPIGAYGRSKWAGEKAVAAANPHHTILRTAWVYSPFGNNFIKTMLRLGETREALSVVADQHGSPTSALDIADAVISIAERILAQPEDPSFYGTFHLTGSGEATWAEFATYIFAEAEKHGRKPVQVHSITTADYPTPARRPSNSRLSNESLSKAFAVRLPAWRLSTANCVARLLRA